jgi:hypothetical protein
LRKANDELSVAYRALGDAGDWLRGWPAGATDEQQAQKAAMFAAIETAKAAINEARPR